MPGNPRFGQQGESLAAELSRRASPIIAAGEERPLTATQTYATNAEITATKYDNCYTNLDDSEDNNDQQQPTSYYRHEHQHRRRCSPGSSRIITSNTQPQHDRFIARTSSPKRCTTSCQRLGVPSTSARPCLNSQSSCL